MMETKPMVDIGESITIEGYPRSLRFLGRLNKEESKEFGLELYWREAARTRQPSVFGYLPAAKKLGLISHEHMAAATIYNERLYVHSILWDEIDVWELGFTLASIERTASALIDKAAT